MINEGSSPRIELIIFEERFSYEKIPTLFYRGRFDAA